MHNTMIGNSLANIRYDTAHRPVVDTSDIIGVKGQVGQVMYTSSPSLLSIWKIVVDSSSAKGTPPDVISKVHQRSDIHSPGLCVFVSYLMNRRIKIQCLFSFI